MSNQPHSFNNSIAAIAAGFGAFFAAGGVAFGTIYAVFFYVVPKPTEWAGPPSCFDPIRLPLQSVR